MIIALITILIIALIIIGVLLVLMNKATKNTPVKDVNVIIVLGCRVRGYTPSTMLCKRVDEAYKYLIKNKNAVAILSGGQGADENISEAQCMKDILLNKGIDKNRLYIEDKSTTTRENLIFSKSIIVNNNLSKTVAVVTSEYHIFRSCVVAKKIGLTPYSIKAKTKLTSIPRNYLREFLAIGKEFIINK